MPDPQPKKIYEFLQPERERFLSFAEDSAELTLPWMSTRGDTLPSSEKRPWTSEGTSGVRSLSSQTLKIIFPPGVTWGRLGFPPYVWDMIEKAAADPKNKKVTPHHVRFLKDSLDIRTTDVINGLTQKNTRSRMATALLRNLIEGSTALNNTEDGLRIYPLRSHAVRRNEFGEVELLALHERIQADLMATDDARRFGKKTDIWTAVDYLRGEVWRQVGDRGGPHLVENESVDQYFVFVSEIPDIENYPSSYTYNYLRLIAQIDHEEASLAEAMADAAWSPVGIREGSVLAEDPNKVMERKTGQPLVHQEGDIFWPDKKGKLNDWAFVAGMKQDDKAELAAIFAKGIKDRPISPDTSATAVIQMIDELNTQTQDLLSAYEETLQRPLFKSEMAIQERRSPLFGELDTALRQMLRITVTTGVNALEKQRTLMRFAIQFLPAVRAMDERLRVNGVELADRMAEGMLIETEGIYEEIDPLVLALQQQLAAGGGLTNGSPQPGALPRTEPKFTRGGPQPVQPSQGAPPTG
jgi:hypothetical protein